MAGLSAKLTSLVEAADDPCLMTYSVMNLGAGVPPPTNKSNLGFARRLQSLRMQLVRKWFSPMGPVARRKRQLQELIQRQQDVVRRRREKELLDIQERKLAEELFQRSSLEVFVRKLPDEPEDTLRRDLQDDSPLARLLVVHTIGRRRLHLETELIERLGDAHPAVRQAAREALVRIARGTDFGPSARASKGAIARSTEKWRQWLALQQIATRGSLAPPPTPGADGEDVVRFDPEMAMKSVLGSPGAASLRTWDGEVGRLADELVKADRTQRDEVLTRLKEAKGVKHTDALALAIPRLPDDLQNRARDALAERLTRMKAKTLRDKLDDEDAEVRRAAAKACALKGSKEHVPDLIRLLGDLEPEVADAAHRALCKLTGKDFGPQPDSSPEQVRRAAADWQAWWESPQPLSK